MRILLFIVFLVLYLVFCWAMSALATYGKRATLGSKTFWFSQFQILLTLGALLCFVFLLSGYFNWLLLIALLGSAEIGVLLATALGGLFGSPTSTSGARAQWAGGEYALKHPPLVIGLSVFSLLITIAYPIAAGVTYFGWSAAPLPARIFQYTLVLCLGGLPLLLLFLMGALVSENLDEETRTRFLINHLAALVPNALWIALILWSFGIAADGLKLSVGSASLALSPLLIGVLIAFFFTTVLIPYLIGTQRAKKWRISLLEKQEDWMGKFYDVLQTPNESLYEQKLTALQESINRDLEAFESADPMIALGVQMDQGVIFEEVAELAPPYKLTRNLDPRFNYLDSLRAMSEQINEIRAALAQLTTKQEMKRVAKEWAVYIKSRKGDLDKALRHTEKRGTPAFWIWSGLIVPIVSVVLSEFAKGLWEQFLKAPTP